jgi:hypothetical protein
MSQSECLSYSIRGQFIYIVVYHEARALGVDLLKKVFDNHSNVRKTI